MGLLDDAIKEHLELKRRRGADPEEVARQEDEALGDPRRGEFAQPDAELEPAAPEAAAPEPEPVAEQAPPPPDEPWLEEEVVAPPPEPAAAQPTAAFTPPDVEPAPAPEPEPEVVRPDEEPPAEDDVLEETPDFLQETPEHDRLWFEQKPPRDFDFDS